MSAWAVVEDLAGHLAWPIVVGGTVLLFRRHLGGLLDDVKRLKVKALGIEAELTRAAKEAERSAEALSIQRAPAEGISEVTPGIARQRLAPFAELARRVHGGDLDAFSGVEQTGVLFDATFREAARHVGVELSITVPLVALAGAMARNVMGSGGELFIETIVVAESLMRKALRVSMRAREVGFGNLNSEAQEAGEKLFDSTMETTKMVISTLDDAAFYMDQVTETREDES